MEWQIILAIVIAVPVLLLPVAFIWWLNFGGVYRMIRDRQRSKAGEKQQGAQEATRKNHA